jgi:putative heme-binding domain-containing protein
MLRALPLLVFCLFVSSQGWASSTGSPFQIQAEAAPVPGGSTTQTPDASNFDRARLVAWCIVPFDARRRGPEERAEMLKRLGIRRLAYDYRAEHVPTFEREILALKAAEIELAAWWFPTELNDEARMILELLRKHEVHPQLWVMGGGQPADESPAAREAHMAAEVRRLGPLVDAARVVGCQVALYNHGGWFGEPENQLAIIAALKQSDPARTNVGIVYNLHHGHDQLARLPELLTAMKPYLLCLNLNGMERGGDRVGRKILPLGAGDLDLAILRAITANGYQGPIGILNHTDLDAELRLRENLNGLEWLRELQEGKNLPPPSFESGEQAAQQKGSLVPLSDQEQDLVEGLLEDARQSGNAARGLTVFAGLKTSCFSCHRLGSHGAAIGPELTGLARRRDPKELVASLFWPNRVVEPEYRATVILRTDGTTIQGYRQAETEDSVTLRDPSSGVESVVPRAEIEDQRLGNSLMPEELMSALTRQQQVDLVRLLLDVGIDPALELQVVDAVLEHAVAHRPAEFPWTREPLYPEDWPNWEAPVNRDRLYDFYTKQAEYFRQRPHGPLLTAAPELDSGKYGHWGNQNEETWKGNEWNETILGSVQCGVFRGERVVVPRAVCVRIGHEGKYAVCFNPDTLKYEIVWQGFLRFSDVRHGFMDGIQQNGQTIQWPNYELPPGEQHYHGFYRFGSEVIFAYRIGDVEYLDSPAFENGQFVRHFGPRNEHPLREKLSGGGMQWPDRLTTSVRFGTGAPYAVDTIELPLNNPWKANLFGGDHDFTSAGDALYATMPGDVWLVSGFSGQPTPEGTLYPVQATWRRFAAGLHQPLGLLVQPDGIFVMCRDQLLRLHDLNEDGEADFYECYSRAIQTSPAGHDYICGLHRDAEGNFYTASGNQGLVQISADGKTARALARGFRNPDGLGLTPDGLATVPCSEGDWTPASMICGVRISEAAQRPADQPLFFGHGGPKNGQAPELPLVYLPRNVDNSAGGQVFVTSDRWGPMKGQLVHLSFGMGSHFLLLRDEAAGQLQGAVVPLRGEFLSGAHRGRFSPTDGQLYVSGMGGWGSYTPELGCFQRVRYTEAPVQLPIGYHVHENGIAIRFAQPLERERAADPRKHFAQCWNYRYSGAYGSAEYAPGHQGIIGHDALQIAAAHVLDDGHTLFLELPELQPVNQLHLRLNVDDSRGYDLYCTVHRLGQPRTDLPNYRPLAKQIAPHPIELDLALATRRIPNRWQQPLEGARRLELAAAMNLSYSTRTLQAKPGEALALVFNNPDVVPHNWALIQPGTLETVGQAANRLIADPEAFLRQYVPESESVIAYTDIVEPGQSQTIWFRAPDKPGRYPYLCTFPGHWMVMNGELVVEE